MTCHINEESRLITLLTTYDSYIQFRFDHLQNFEQFNHVIELYAIIPRAELTD